MLLPPSRLHRWQGCCCCAAVRPGCRPALATAAATAAAAARGRQRPKARCHCRRSRSLAQMPARWKVRHISCDNREVPASVWQVASIKRPWARQHTVTTNSQYKGSTAWDAAPGRGAALAAPCSLGRRPGQRVCRAGAAPSPTAQSRSRAGRVPLPPPQLRSAGRMCLWSGMGLPHTRSRAASHGVPCDPHCSKVSRQCVLGCGKLGLLLTLRTSCSARNSACSSA